MNIEDYSIMKVQDLDENDAMIISAMFTGTVRKKSSFSQAWPYQTGNYNVLVTANKIANAVLFKIFK